MHHVLQYVPLGLLVIAVCGGFYELVKVLTRVASSIHKRFDTIVHMIEEVEHRVGQVEREFKPNGGSSMKDDLNKLKGDVRDLGTKHDAHLMQHAGQWR